jgi:hypothetical protein
MRCCVHGFGGHVIPDLLRCRGDRVWARDLAACFCPSLTNSLSLSRNRGRRECRVHAAPAVSRAKNCALGAHEHTGERKHSDIPCAMALRRTSCSPRRANSSCHRRLRKTYRKLGTSNGCQDHTTWPYAPAFRPALQHHPFGIMPPRLTPKRPSHPRPYVS